MSRWNATQKPDITTTFEGGEAYHKKPVNAYLEYVCGNLLGGKFYENDADQVSRLVELTNQMTEQYGPEFVAKTAIFSRNVIGIRSASTLVASLLNSEQFQNKRNFYATYFRRPDDVAEMFAVIESRDEKRSHALINGARDYLSSLGEYQLGKYKLDGKQYNMFDLINLTHATSAAINAYKHGELQSPDTWEVGISTAANAEEKNAEWLRLLDENKLGYLALLRNIRNITKAIEYPYDYIVNQEYYLEILCEQLGNATAIRKSLVMPYQIYSAYCHMDTTNTQIIAALEKAFVIATQNMPMLDGINLLVLDVSASMTAPISPKSNISILQAGACYAAALYLKGNFDLIKFGTQAKEVRLSKLDSPFTMIKKIAANDGCGFSTDMHEALDIFEDRHYDRVFVVSDMQVLNSSGWGWFDYNIDSGNPVRKRINRYIDKNHCHVYSFDLGGYASTVVNPQNKYTHGLTCLSDKLFELIPIIESDEDAIIKYIDEGISF